MECNRLFYNRLTAMGLKCKKNKNKMKSPDSKWLVFIFLYKVDSKNLDRKKNK